MFEEEKPPIMNEGEREKYGCHTRSMSGIEVMRQQPRINITGALEAQRDDTWQKASLIYEAKIEQVKWETARIEKERILGYLKSLLEQNPKANLATTIDLIEISRPSGE